MTPVCYEDLKPQDFKILELVRMIVYRLPDGLTCHDVCREVMGRLHGDHDLIQVTGHFLGGYDHSWLVSTTRPVILDPYPWACASGPLLLSLEGTLNPWRMVYNPLPPCLLVEENPS